MSAAAGPHEGGAPPWRKRCVVPGPCLVSIGIAPGKLKRGLRQWLDTLPGERGQRR